MTLEIILAEDIHTEAIAQFVKCLKNNKEVTFFTPELNAEEVNRRVNAKVNPLAVRPNCEIDHSTLMLTLPTFSTVIIAETEAILVNQIIQAQPETTRIILITGDASKVTDHIAVFAIKFAKAERKREGTLVLGTFFTEIEEVDVLIGGFTRGKLYDFTAQPGEGLTKFLLGALLYNASVNYKMDSLFITSGQTATELKSYLVMLHARKEGFSDLRDAEGDLFCNSDNGEIMIQEAESLDLSHTLVDRCDVLIVDNMSLIESSYKDMATYIKRRNKIGITGNGLTPQGVAQISEGLTVEAMHTLSGTSLSKYTEERYTIRPGHKDGIKEVQSNNSGQHAEVNCNLYLV